MTENCAGQLPQALSRTRIATGASADAPVELSPTLNSTQLLGHANKVFICHEGERYTLRRTSKGRLILTK